MLIIWELVEEKNELLVADDGRSELNKGKEAIKAIKACFNVKAIKITSRV